MTITSGDFYLDKEGFEGSLTITAEGIDEEGYDSFIKIIFPGIFTLKKFINSLDMPHIDGIRFYTKRGTDGIYFFKGSLEEIIKTDLVHVMINLLSGDSIETDSLIPNLLMIYFENIPEKDLNLIKENCEKI